MIAQLIISYFVITMVINSQSIYDYQIEALNSDEVIHLSAFKGKNILFVNVASNCGFTSQYQDLQELYERYNGKLVIIGFPCNSIFISGVRQ